MGVTYSSSNRLSCDGCAVVYLSQFFAPDEDIQVCVRGLSDQEFWDGLFLEYAAIAEVVRSLFLSRYGRGDAVAMERRRKGSRPRPGMWRGPGLGGNGGRARDGVSRKMADPRRKDTSIASMVGNDGQKDGGKGEDGVREVEEGVDRAIALVLKSLGKATIRIAQNIALLLKAVVDRMNIFEEDLLEKGETGKDELRGGLQLVHVTLNVLLSSGASETNIFYAVGAADDNGDMETVTRRGRDLIAKLVEACLSRIETVHIDRQSSREVAVFSVWILTTLMSSQMYRPMGEKSLIVEIIDELSGRAGKVLHGIFRIMRWTDSYGISGETDTRGVNRPLGDIMAGVYGAVSAFSSRILRRDARDEYQSASVHFSRSLTDFRCRNEEASCALTLISLLCSPRGEWYSETNRFERVMKDHALAFSEQELSFRNMYSSILHWLDDERGALIFYYLINGNNRFRTFIHARTDLDSFMVPLLRLVYRTVDSGLPSSYVGILCVLILTQDRGFCEALNPISVAWNSLPWFEERNRLLGKDITLLGLTFLIFIRAVQANNGRTVNPFIVQASLAVLGNLSNYPAMVEPFPAERLVNLVELMIRRCRRATLRQKEEEFDVETFYDSLGTLLEIIANILKGGLEKNRNIVYALLHKEALIEGPDILEVSSRCHVVGSRLSTILTYFSGCVESANASVSESTGGLTVEEIYHMISTKASNLPKDILTSLPGISFEYAQSSECSEFFVPLVWSFALEHSVWPTDVAATSITLPSLRS